jgi:LPXTG-site transpeptidase (sortase) family protein
LIQKIKNIGKVVIFSLIFILMGSFAEKVMSASVFEDGNRVFAQGVVSWGQLIKLTAIDGVADDHFGSTVAMSGDTLVIGADWDDDKGASSGSVYVFERSGGVWVLSAKFTAFDGDANDYFGYSVAVDGNIVAVGAYFDDDNGTSSGSVYVFEKSAFNWVLTEKLTASDAAARDNFGNAVAVSDGAIVVGAYYDDDNDTNSGSVYVFEKSGGFWQETGKLIASDGSRFDYFGYAVAVSDSVLAVGAQGVADKGSRSGAVYVFEKSGGIWTEREKLLADDGVANDYLGYAVAVSGNRILGGAYGVDANGSMSGAAYLFEKSGGGSWQQIEKLMADDGAAGDGFGSTVTISGDDVAMGAEGDDDGGSGAGSVYVFGTVIGVGGGSGSADTAESVNLPQTGFAHNDGSVFDLMKPTDVIYSHTDFLLSIPKLDLEMVIVGVSKSGMEWDVTWLGNDAGYLYESAYPTTEGNTVLVGHVWDNLNQAGPFAELKNLGYGDEILIETVGNVYVYEVRESEVIAPNDLDSVFEEEVYDWVTLLTCENYQEGLGTYAARRIVRAVLVEVR